MESKSTEVYQNEVAESQETECEKVAFLLDLIVDGEASDDELTYFNNHIEECAPCFEGHQKQKLLKGLVSGHLKRILVPEALMLTIKAKIQKTV